MSDLNLREEPRFGADRIDDHPRFRRVNAPVLCRVTGLRVSARSEQSRQTRSRDAAKDRMSESRSPAGLRFFSDAELAVDQCVDVELLLPDRTAFVCLARVAWVRPLGNNERARFDVGIEILHPRGQSLKRLAPVLSAP